MRFNRPCLKCNTLHRDKGDYCASCRANYERQREADPARRAKKRGLYNSEYQRRRKALVTATIEHNLFCHLCNKPFLSPADITADHLMPGEPNSPLAPAHRSCNSSRGNRPLEI